uniref:LITAF domain-containing protein n=1 Tax=Daphnia galeata TaxID=27404 RepID=A0A8J2S423_9CRUS|nr:unnamed protein product [Daphnia galeata]
MSKQGPPPAAPPSYMEAVGGVNPSSPFTPHQNVTNQQPIIVTTVIPVCPHCHAEIDTSVRTEPGLIAWLSGGLLVLFGYGKQ